MADENDGQPVPDANFVVNGKRGDEQFAQAYAYEDMSWSRDSSGREEENGASVWRRMRERY